MSLAVLDPISSADSAPAHRPANAVDAAVDAVCKRIAPLWPLKTFVAVNPFLGFVDRPFEEACADYRRIVGVDMLPRSGPDGPATIPAPADRPAPRETRSAHDAFMIDEISRWCAAYYDEGQAVWRAPSRRLGLFAGWKAAMVHDRNAEAMGIAGFRAMVATAPADPHAAIAAVVDALDIPSHALEDYLFRVLFDVRGWAAYARQRSWTAALHGGSNEDLVDLLAVRVVWDLALVRSQCVPRARSGPAMAAAFAGRDAAPAIAAGLQQLATLERTYQRDLFAALADAETRPHARRPALQAAFCIDVRSEPFRRALEMVCPDVETIGFAGFFGFPIEYVPIGQHGGGAQCPVLLAPRFVVREGVKQADAQSESRVLALRRLRRRAFKAWKAFKLSAISSFSFVETAGLLFGPKLVGDALGLTRPVAHPRSDGLAPDVVARLGPHIEPETWNGRATGFGGVERIDMAEAVLRAMSLTRDFAPFVLLAGHGATTVNNPHAAGLDCGACGGHTGEANARVAAAILNDRQVRRGLADRGIDVPDDTWFVAALHDTTCDAVHLFDLEEIPTQRRTALAELRAWLDAAADHARLMRAPRLGIAPDADAHAAILDRTHDWSQIRPEWGLAGCAAFIAAPRDATAGLDLEGRVFLHTYDWRSDEYFKTLELIMTAPMVVASWINLQYYGSTVDNDAFGAGDKTLHNVVGTLGVLEGNAGDLKAGLPLQSVHDGRRFVHEPLRLTVVVAAPTDAIDAVIARHESVRHLVDHGWLHLFALGDDRTIRQRHRGAARWSSAR